MTTSVNLVGNLTREPELRYTGGGQPVASFGLAVNRRVQNKQTNDWQDQTSFFDVTCFGTLAENVAGSLAKGARAVVTGRLEQRTWEAKDGSGNRSKVEVVADEVGPSLRWATADITKNERRAGGDTGDDGRPF
jgi:single-strand DNA-binding protein